MFLSKTGKYIFGQEKGQCIIVQNTTNPCKTHSPSALLHIYSSFTWNNIISRTISQYYKVILFPYCLASIQTSFCVWHNLALRYFMQIMDNDHFSFLFLKKCLNTLAAQRQILTWLFAEVPHCRFSAVWKSTEETNWQLKEEKILSLCLWFTALNYYGKQDVQATVQCVWAQCAIMQPWRSLNSLVLLV